MQPDILAESIHEAFDSLNEKVLKNIHARWRKVLDLMVQDKGDNQFVVKWRNKDKKVEDLVHVNEEEIGILVNSSYTRAMMRILWSHAMRIKK